MNRKIIELGNNCMVMSLPIKWIRENNLKKGLELHVDVKDNQLTIESSQREKKPLILEVEIKDIRESATRTILVNAYRAGYDKLIVNYQGNKRNLNKIVTKHMLGFELFSQKNLHTIESVSEPSYDNVEKIIQKMFFIVSEILKEIPGKEIEEEVNRVQRYDNFIKRCISKKTVYLKSQTFMWQFLSNLTQIARQCYHLNKSLKNFNEKEKKVMEKIQEMFSNLHKGYLKKDINILMDLHRMEQEIVYDKRKELLKNPVIGHYLISIARLIYLTNSPLIGVIELEKEK